MIQVLTCMAIENEAGPHKKTTGGSAAWLAHLLWEQGVVGSNPTRPTSLVSPVKAVKINAAGNRGVA